MKIKLSARSAARGAAGLLASIASLVVVSCDTGPDFDRREMLESLSDVVIIPQYRAFSEDATALANEATAFCAAPSEASLGTVRARWAGARTAYLRTQAHSFGTAMDLRLTGEIDFRPTRTGTIETTIASTDELTESFIDGLGVAGKGLPAIEYLLYPPGLDDATTVTSLGEARRCAYMAGLAAHVARRAEELVGGWDPGYRETFTTAGHGSTVLMSEHAAISLVINRFLSVLEDIKLSRLGGPLGELEAPADPTAVESPYGGHDVAGMLATLRGLRSMWSGDFADVEGIGIDALVEAYDPLLAAKLTREIDDAIGTMEAVEPPLSLRIADGDVADAEAAYLAIRAAERTIGTDVAQTLAVTVTFTDNDGD